MKERLYLIVMLLIMTEFMSSVLAKCVRIEALHPLK